MIPLMHLLGRKAAPIFSTQAPAGGEAGAAPEIPSPSSQPWEEKHQTPSLVASNDPWDKSLQTYEPNTQHTMTARASPSPGDEYGPRY